jgi:hypothetical protein
MIVAAAAVSCWMALERANTRPVQPIYEDIDRTAACQPNSPGNRLDDEVQQLGDPVLQHFQARFHHGAFHTDRR